LWFTGPYFLRADVSQLLWAFLALFARHAFRALASLCARVSTFDLGVSTADGATFPAPENVALAGAPNPSGGGGGALRQASEVVQGGGTVETGWVQEDPAGQTCAS
jgi:hypothetical protein